jgi:hypothetical protein
MRTVIKIETSIHLRKKKVINLGMAAAARYLAA